jgi:hypothetical protein
MHEGEEVELADFLEADERLATGGFFTLEEIAEEVMRSTDSDESEEDEPLIEDVPTSFEEAQRALSTVRKFMVRNSGEFDVMQACDRLEDKMQEIRQKKMRQLTILESFGLE